MTSNTDSCECGASFCAGNPADEEWHRENHEKYEQGPEIPEVQSLQVIAVKGDLRLIVVDHSIEESIRRAVAHVAMVAQRCMPKYTAGYYGTDSEANCRLYALCDGARIIGMVISSVENVFWRMSWNSESRYQATATEPISRTGPKISRIWIAASYRQRGLAKWLVKEVAKHADVEVFSLGWEFPLTDNGTKLVKALCAGEFLGCGDIRCDNIRNY